MTTLGLEAYEQFARALHLWNRANDTGHGAGDALRALSSVMKQEPAPDLDEWLGLPSQRLAVYGTLAPGKSNHGQLAALVGTWSRGTVRGILRPAGWAQSQGYSGLIWDPAGDPVEVQVFDSADLPQHWDRLDAFEGEDYERLLIPVERGGRLTVANLYALAHQG